jgi:uncharacterized membrane protein (DUF441 family)
VNPVVTPSLEVDDVEVWVLDVNVVACVCPMVPVAVAIMAFTGAGMFDANPHTVPAVVVVSEVDQTAIPVAVPAVDVVV